MTNDDMITCLLLFGEVTLENCPLKVIPGNHQGLLYSHWHGGFFTGSIADEVLNDQQANMVKCTGPAGSVCLMHARLLYRSASKLSSMRRTLYVATYYAENAIELSPNYLPSRFTHELVCGKSSGRVRCTPYEMELPKIPKGTSFFSQQAETPST